MDLCINSSIMIPLSSLDGISDLNTSCAVTNITLIFWINLFYLVN